MNLPNRLTLTRILMVPVFMLFLLPFPDWLINTEILAPIEPNLLYLNGFISKYGNYYSAIVFILAASTDGLDGYIARKRKQVTNLGKFLDPIADKLLVTAALIALVARAEVTPWAATIIISREFIVTGLRLVASADGVVIAASKLGKLKTIVQMIAIIATLLKNYPFVLFVDFHFDKYAMFLAVIVTVYSGYDYIIKNMNVITNENKKNEVKMS